MSNQSAFRGTSSLAEKREKLLESIRKRQELEIEKIINSEQKMEELARYNAEKEKRIKEKE